MKVNAVNKLAEGENVARLRAELGCREQKPQTDPTPFARSKPSLLAFYLTQRHSTASLSTLETSDLCHALCIMRLFRRERETEREALNFPYFCTVWWSSTTQKIQIRSLSDEICWYQTPEEESSQHQQLRDDKAFPLWAVEKPGSGTYTPLTIY